MKGERRCQVCGSLLPEKARGDQRFCSGRCRTRFWVVADPDRRDAAKKLRAVRRILEDAEPSDLGERIRSILDEDAPR